MVILLDEPTSGLDSSSAFNIVQLLKKEAARGKTVIATIHQPSGKIFMQFDRLLLLHDGFQLYQGPLIEIAGYLRAELNIMQLSRQKYFNTADFIIKMAQVPADVRFKLSHQEIRETYDTKIAPKIHRQMEAYERKYEGFQARFSMISADRSVSGWRQFSELFKRNIKYLLRNEATMRVTFFNGSFIALLLLCLYFKMSDVDLEHSI